MIVKMKFGSNGEKRRFFKYGMRLMVQYTWKSQGTAWRMLRMAKKFKQSKTQQK
jgi:hypothetical protein